jgi:hypothetical protein
VIRSASIARKAKSSRDASRDIFFIKHARTISVVIIVKITTNDAFAVLIVVTIRRHARYTIIDNPSSARAIEPRLAMSRDASQSPHFRWHFAHVRARKRVTHKNTCQMFDARDDVSTRGGMGGQDIIMDMAGAHGVERARLHMSPATTTVTTTAAAATDVRNRNALCRACVRGRANTRDASRGVDQ